MNGLCITLDIDWATEPAIEETLQFFAQREIPVTLFTTHHSPAVERALNSCDVGLHPNFGSHSSQGETIERVVRTVTALPHNLPAFRCHRFASCNASREAMAAAGMKISSNVCTDLQIVHPFRDRYGLLEMPIFFEDGGYLWRRHPMELTPKLTAPGPRLLLIHPMHFALNTPHFTYMRQIKDRLSPVEWQQMSRSSLATLEWTGRGIRDLLVEWIESTPHTFSLREWVAALSEQHDLPAAQLQ